VGFIITMATQPPYGDIKKKKIRIGTMSNKDFLKSLTRAERLIVVLYYYEGMTIKEIAEKLELSESRVSRMHSSIIQRLKNPPKWTG